MTIISSISAALGHVNLSITLHSLRFSASALVTSAAVFSASYIILFGLLEIDKPKGFRQIPRLSGFSSLRTLLQKTPFPEGYEKDMRAVQEEHGISRVNMMGHSIVYITSTEYARQFLMHADTFPKLVLTEKIPGSASARFYGNNIVFSNGDNWKRHRRVCNPAFHKSWSTEVFGECSETMIKSMLSEMNKEEGKGVIDADDYFKRLTLDALGKAAFGYDFNAIENPDGEFVSKYNSVMAKSFNPYYFIFPWLDNIPFFRRTSLLKDMDDFDALIFQIINAKKEKLKHDKEESSDDLLSLMIKTSDNEGGISTEELRSNMIIFFVAGHDTTSNALACALYSIARNPHLQDQLHAEVISHLGSSTSDAPIPTLEEIRNMDLLNAVIKETLRLYPSVNVLPQRSVECDTPIGPYMIPPGADIMLNIYSIHHNPKYWDDPEEFRPERFKGIATDVDAQGGIIGGKRDPLAWVPFSYGSRSCIGMNFSLIEQCVVLAMLVHKFRFALPEDTKHKDGIKFLARSISTPDDLRIEFSPRY